MGNVGGAVGGIIELVNGAVINSSVTFTFYKTKDNSARKVIITARSTSVKILLIYMLMIYLIVLLLQILVTH